jgi:hypothetical protein
MTIDCIVRWIKKLWKSQSHLELEHMELRMEFMRLQLEIDKIRKGEG